VLEEEAQMMEWDTHEANPGYIEVEDRRAANKNHGRSGDFLIEPVMDRLLAGCMEMLFHTFCDAA